MRDSFPPGSWAAGSPGDPELDGLLPAGIAESLLDGRSAAVPTDLRPLGEALAALRAAPSATEFRGEEAALAAFRSIRGRAAFGPARAQWTASPAPTVPLEIPPGMADRRPRRARHAAPRRAGSARLSAGPRLGLVTAAAAALVLIVGIFAYSGHLPEPIQSAAHVVIGAPSVQRHATTRPTTPATGGGRLNGSSATPAAGRPTATATTAAPSGSATTAPAGPRQWCQAYFKSPWRPGSTSWDMSDFTKLAKAAGGPRWVLKYCLPYLTGLPWSGGHGFRFPTGFDAGSWAWPPSGEAHGHGNKSTATGSGIFGGSGQTTAGPAIGSVPTAGSASAASSASAGKSRPAATNSKGANSSPTAGPRPPATPKS
ncbi:MAG: DNA-directed polymerase specialized sigma subunit, sigma24 family [Actinomycetia bacterium]|nr:DNA-directed polymerase specialized sigma subunit, sigma24 family [Actinomycetes bacterium]